MCSSVRERESPCTSGAPRRFAAAAARRISPAESPATLATRYSVNLLRCNKSRVYVYGGCNAGALNFSHLYLLVQCPRAGIFFFQDVKIQNGMRGNWRKVRSMHTYFASCVAMSLSRLSLWSMLMRYCIGFVTRMVSDRSCTAFFQWRKKKNDGITSWSLSHLPILDGSGDNPNQETKSRQSHS